MKEGRRSLNRASHSASLLMIGKQQDAGAHHDGGSLFGRGVTSKQASITSEGEGKGRIDKHQNLRNGNSFRT